MLKSIYFHHAKSTKTHRPAIRNREKQGFFAKNGHFDQKFTQPALEPAHRFLSTYTQPASKFPAKITGIFLEHIRESSTTIRDFF